MTLRSRVGNDAYERADALFYVNNAAIAAASAGKALVDDDCAKKAVDELTRE